MITYLPLTGWYIYTQTWEDTPTRCGVTGPGNSVARLIIVTKSDEKVDWGTPLTGILKHNTQLPPSLHFLVHFIYLPHSPMMVVDLMLFESYIYMVLCLTLLHAQIQRCTQKVIAANSPCSLATLNNVRIELCGQSAVLVSLQQGFYRPLNLKEIHTPRHKYRHTWIVNSVGYRQA